MTEDLYSIRLDSVQIGVADLDHACRSYSLILGVPSERSAEGLVRFQLNTGAVELMEGEDRIRSIRFVGRDVRSTRGESFDGIEVLVSPTGADSPSNPTSTDVEAIDHIVVRTMNVERAVRRWRDTMGLRLALDREFPERGLRLAFFRSGGMTLEIAGASHGSGDGADSLYGVTYRVRNVAACRDRLAAAGVEVSPLRTGFKPGTTVATVQSATAGVPTLLLQDSSRG